MTNDGGIRRAGLAAILGGAAFFGSLLITTVFGLEGVYEGSLLAASLSNGVLLAAWALMLWGLSGLRSYGRGQYGRLWATGTALTGIGLALCTIGFVAETFAPLLGFDVVAGLGGVMIGLSLLSFVPIGAVVLGVALLRTGAVSRLAALLMIAAGPSMLAAMLIGGALPALLGTVLFAGVLGAAWIAVGYELRTVPVETASSTVPV